MDEFRVGGMPSDDGLQIAAAGIELPAAAADGKPKRRRRHLRSFGRKSMIGLGCIRCQRHLAAEIITKSIISFPSFNFCHFFQALFSFQILVLN